MWCSGGMVEVHGKGAAWWQGLELVFGVAMELLSLAAAMALEDDGGRVDAMRDAWVGGVLDGSESLGKLDGGVYVAFDEVDYGCCGGVLAWRWACCGGAWWEVMQHGGCLATWW